VGRKGQGGRRHLHLQPQHHHDIDSGEALSHVVIGNIQKFVRRELAKATV